MGEICSVLTLLLDGTRGTDWQILPIWVDYTDKATACSGQGWVLAKQKIASSANSSYQQ